MLMNNVVLSLLIPVGHLPHLQQDDQTQRNEPGVHGDPQHARERCQTQDPSVNPQSQHGVPQDSCSYS